MLKHHTVTQSTHAHTYIHTHTQHWPPVWHAYFIDNLSLHSQSWTQGGILVKSRIIWANIFFSSCQELGRTFGHFLSSNLWMLFDHRGCVSVFQAILPPASKHMNILHIRLIWQLVNLFLFCLFGLYFSFHNKLFPSLNEHNVPSKHLCVENDPIAPTPPCSSVISATPPHSGSDRTVRDVTRVYNAFWCAAEGVGRNNSRTCGNINAIVNMWLNIINTPKGTQWFLTRGSNGIRKTGT